MDEIRMNELKTQARGGNSSPTWGYLLRQIVVGLIEIAIPLGFIVAMIYWRAPWLFWAVVHLLRGEPVFHF